MYVHCVPAKSNMQDLTKIQTSTSDAPTLPRGYPMIIIVSVGCRQPVGGGKREGGGNGAASKWCVPSDVSSRV